MTTTKTRKSVPLDARDLTRVGRFDTDTILHAIAARHAGVEAIGSEAVLMHTLLVAGLDALEQEADEERYRALANAQDDDDRSYHAARHTRRRDA